MSKSRALWLAVLLNAALLVGNVAFTVTHPARAATRYQYKVISTTGEAGQKPSRTAEDILNKLAAEGWEYCGGSVPMLILRK